MTGFSAPPVEDFFGNQTIGIWVSQVGAKHVGMTYIIKSKNGKALGLENDALCSENHSNENAFDLHFLDDNFIKNEPVNWSVCNKRRLAAVVELDEFTKVSFPVYLHNTVAKSDIRYGIDWLGNIGSINQNGSYNPPLDRPGFTCATYLCEVFRSYGLTVVDVNSWPVDSPEIKSWARNLVARFQNKNREQTIRDIESTKPLIRLEPAEFASAASMGIEAWPVQKLNANALALRIIQDFNERFASAK
ncbi:MAG: hypothetical protein ACK4FF_05770 [Limnobacter sp.]|uniref:hypothetical protein n=1 Tax=Limnobacter sp. TaxID=2003368 RepID=UPI00391AFA4A